MEERDMRLAKICFIVGIICTFKIAPLWSAAADIELKMTDVSSLDFVKTILENPERNRDWVARMEEWGIRVSDEIRKASCTFRVVRPDNGDSDVHAFHSNESSATEKHDARERLLALTEKNHVDCTIETPNREVAVRLPMKGNLLEPWGNRFEKRPFEFSGPLAENFYWSIRSRIKKMGEDYRMCSSILMAGPGGDMFTESWMINQQPDGEAVEDISPLAISCMRDSDFSPVMESAKKLYVSWAAAHPHPTQQDQSEFGKLWAKFWAPILGSKDGIEAIDDQIERKVRTLYRPISCVVLDVD
jgi:hypothetical protein